MLRARPRRMLLAFGLVQIGACSLGVSAEDEYFRSSAEKNSCTGHCGSEAPVPGSTLECYCDQACTESGDCCPDYVAVCAPDGSAGDAGEGGIGSCQGVCGSPDPAPGSFPECYCDATCVDSGDCCADYSTYCGSDGG